MIDDSKINYKVLLRAILSIFLLLSTSLAEAQDTLIKRNKNEKIIAKITEVNSTEVKYKLFNYQDGPLFIVHKWELKRVIYGNGLIEEMDSIKPPVTPQNDYIKKDLTIIKSGSSYLYQSHRIMELDMLGIAQGLNDKKLNLIVKRTHDIRFTRKAFSTAAIVVGGFGLLTYVGVVPINKTSPAPTYGGRGGRAGRNANIAYHHTIGGYFMLGALACEAVSLVINMNEIKHAHLVVNTYNKLVSN